MMSFLENLTVKEIVNSIVGIIGVLSVLIEFNKKIPFNPWSTFVKWVGKCLTTGIDKKIDVLSEQTQANNNAIIELNEKVEYKFAEKQKDDDEKEAKRLRESIISFADSCRVGNHHTQNHFENVFRNYSDYTTYCERHGIPNHYIDSEYKYIEEVYQECLKENKFI